MTHFLNPARQPGESRADYVRRRKWGAVAVRTRLAAGAPAEGYVNGPHKTHRPKEIVVMQEAKGAMVPHRIVHPGTLRRKV